MNRLTASNIVTAIDQLPKNVCYNYIFSRTKTKVEVVGVDLPEGPIRIRRWYSDSPESKNNGKETPISSKALWRCANAFSIGQPANIDRIFGASYNIRSALETLLAHTPEFYYCYPGRIEDINGDSSIRNGHKHLMWRPDIPHKNGVLEKIDTDIVISEIPNINAVYEALVLPEPKPDQELDIDVQRRHAQIQIALYFIGLQLGFRTWVAQNDKGIVYRDKKLGEYEGIISSLKNEKLLSAFEDAINAAKMIDCIWFKNGTLMPAVMEIEHSTGVTSGLSRMKNFQDKFPPFPTRYVIVAPDEDRGKVIKEASKPQFHSLDVRFFPYSAVEEFYSLCQRRKIKGVTEQFLDCFMEPVLSNENNLLSLS